ncbi:acyl-CoA N-acyltransferase [Hypoxylon sp. NC1633]|nr:acyl-CoA N-acyltransferase [Hypoxylon sp. NC1633]
MPLEIRPATAADAKRAAEIESAAYAPNPFNAVLFPGPFPPNVLDGRAGQLAAELEKDPTARWFKVVDTDLPEPEQMISFAKWHIYADGPPPPSPRNFGPFCNVEACELLFGSVATQRARVLEGRPYVYLHLLHTDPKHQRRGAGGMLVQWGVEEARRLGLIAYLDASEEGHLMYQKHGFRDIELLSLDMSQWGPTQKHNIWSMIWDPSEPAV